MNRPDAARLLSIIAVCDRRTIGETDVEVWASLLSDLRLVDCVEAVHTHYRNSSEWLDPHKLRDLVRVMRAKRLDQHEIPPPPANLANDPVGAIEWQREWIRRIADGETPAQIEAPFTRNMPPLGNVFPAIPAPDYSGAAARAREYLAAQARARAAETPAPAEAEEGAA